MHTINTKYTFKQNINYTSICHVIFLPSFLIVLEKFTVQNCYYLHVIILHLSAVFIEIKFYYILLYTVIIHSILFHLLYSIYTILKITVITVLLTTQDMQYNTCRSSPAEIFSCQYCRSYR